MMTEKEINKKFFESQDPDEKILVIVRKHKLVLAASFISAFFLAIIIVVFLVLMSTTNILDNERARAIAVAISSLAFLYILLYAFVSWLIKYLDILILTSKHLVIIGQHGLFKRSISTLDLSTIQDVAVDQKGVIQTFLNFGKVTVQTAGEMPNFVYGGVSRPCEIQDAVMDAKELYVKGQHNISSPVVKETEQI